MVCDLCLSSTPDEDYYVESACVFNCSLCVVIIGEYVSLELLYLDNHHVLFIKFRLITLVPY